MYGSLRSYDFAVGDIRLLWSGLFKPAVELQPKKVCEFVWNTNEDLGRKDLR